VQISSTTLIIPGNGFLYVSGHTIIALIIEEICLERERILEVRQPFYYVGIESRTLKDLAITSKKQSGEIVAHIQRTKK